MFRKWPFFQRLLSRTKPYAPPERTTREFERWDWNSLLATEPELRGSPGIPGRDVRLSVASGDGGEPHGLRGSRGVVVRVGCEWQSTRHEETADGERFVLVTNEGEYRCRFPIFAVGVAQPYAPTRPASTWPCTTPTPAMPSRTRASACSSSASRTRASSSWRPGSSSGPAGSRSSPSPAKTSIETRSLVWGPGPLRPAVRGLDPWRRRRHPLGEHEGISRSSSGALTVTLERSDNAMPMTVEADEVIAATGFTCPSATCRRCRDLRAVEAPAPDRVLESASTFEIYFAGTITRAQPPQEARHSVQLRRRPGPPLQRPGPGSTPAQQHFGITLEKPLVDVGDLRDHLLHEAANAPELWHQKAYLASIVTLDPTRRSRRRRPPLTHFLDHDGPDAVAMTVRATAGRSTRWCTSGATARRGARPRARPLHDFEGRAYRCAPRSILDRLTAGASAA